MKRLKTVFAVLWGIGLLMLFLAATTDLFLNDQEADYFRVSVVWDDTTEDYVGHYKNNMARYMNLRSLDFHFCTLKEPVNAKQQMEMILQEEKDGADLILVKPVDEAGLEELLEKSPLKVPLICVDGRMESDQVRVSLYSDDEQRGCHLAERVKKEHPESELCILTDGRNTGRDERMYQAVKEAAGGMKVKLCEWDGKSRLPYDAEDGKKIVFLALNTRLLEQAARWNDQEHPLYGFGYTDNILYAMEQGKIQAVNVHSDFQMGWESIRYALKILDGEAYEKEVILEDHTIGAKEMFDQEYEDILFYLGGA